LLSKESAIILSLLITGLSTVRTR